MASIDDRVEVQHDTHEAPKAGHAQTPRTAQDQTGTELSDLTTAGRVQSNGTSKSNTQTGIWHRFVTITVSHDDCRDHFANERTFLSYLRTSLALAAIGVVVAQVLRLQHQLFPSPGLGYYVVGKPLGALFQASAIGLQLIGAHRFWRQQLAMSRGRALAGGWEIYTVMVFFMLLTIAILVLLIAIDIHEGLG